MLALVCKVKGYLILQFKKYIFAFYGRLTKNDSIVRKQSEILEHPPIANEQTKV